VQSVNQYLATLDGLEGERGAKKARIFELRERVIKGRLNMLKILSHMSEVMARAKDDSAAACTQVNQIFSELKLKLAAKEAEVMSTMQARYAGLSDELTTTVEALRTMADKSAEIAAMTADVITGSDEQAMSLLDKSSDQLEDQLQQLITSQELKVMQTAEQVLASQVGAVEETYVSLLDPVCASVEGCSPSARRLVALS
jgi:DNA anti-recombination protein RmuC